MNANICQLYSSPLFRITDFKCLHEKGTISNLEWVGSFNISFVRKGNFGYRITSDFCDIHSGVILLENPNTEYTISHTHHVKDECTSLWIDESLLVEIAQTYSHQKQSESGIRCSSDGFKFSSPVMRSTPKIEYLHRLIYQSSLGKTNEKSLKTDMLVLSLLQRIFTQLANTNEAVPPLQLNKRLKDLHLETIDRGKNYILRNFQNNLNLSDIAHNAHVSPFHFSRLFKHFTAYSPCQYLLEVRLNHAVLLLKNTSLTVTEICFESGFNSLEHFIATFTGRYGTSPLKFRHLRTC